MRKCPAIILALVFGLSVVSMAQTQASSQSGTASASSNSDGVKYFPKDDVMASFGKGGTLTNEGNYRVMTAHRTPTTEAKVEVHRSYVDVFYIVQGSTTIIT